MAVSGACALLAACSLWQRSAVRARLVACGFRAGGASSSGGSPAPRATPAHCRLCLHYWVGWFLGWVVSSCLMDGSLTLKTSGSAATLLGSSVCHPPALHEDVRTRDEAVTTRKADGSAPGRVCHYAHLLVGLHFPPPADDDTLLRCVFCYGRTDGGCLRVSSHCHRYGVQFWRALSGQRAGACAGWGLLAC